jgi:hypothetical protein
MRQLTLLSKLLCLAPPTILIPAYRVSSHFGWAKPYQLYKQSFDISLNSHSSMLFFLINRRIKMKLLSFQLKNIRCFEDTGAVDLSQNVNVFVGRNNSGKTTILSSILSLQTGFQFGHENVRPHTNDSAFVKFDVQWPNQPFSSNIGIGAGMKQVSLLYTYDGSGKLPSVTHQPGVGNPAFVSTRPNAVFEPFLARRKAVAFQETANSGVSNNVTGTLQYLYSRIAEIAVSGHPRHEKFRKALDDVLGFQITTRLSSGGTEAGFYFDLNNF